MRQRKFEGNAKGLCYIDKMISPSRILPLVIAAALFMENMDGTVIATSLPAIALDLGTDPVSLKLAFTTYLLSLTVFLPISGWMADRYGAKLIFRLAIVVFTLASFGCGFTPNLTWLVALRGLQGLGGAMMVPVGRIIMIRSIPKSELVNAMAWLTVPALIGPLLGPPIGGFITTYFHWRWIFWMNVPFGILGIILATRFMPDTRELNVPPLDVKGFVLSGMGLALTVFGCTVVGRGLIPEIFVLGMIAAGVVMITLYIRHAQKVANPILDLSLLRIDTLRISITGGLFFRFAAGAMPFLLPLMLQLGFGLTAFQSGLITCAAALGALTMKFGAGSILRRFGYRNLLIVNGLLSCLLTASLGFLSPHMSYILMMLLLLAGGVSRSMQFTALNSIAYADVTTAQVSKANGLYTVMQQLSLAMGVAVAATVLDVSQWWRGATDLAVVDFSAAFIIVSLGGIFSSYLYMRLPLNAGASLSGHRAEI
jgi:EmrB/QacA subfamily drug resistance transporter